MSGPKVDRVEVACDDDGLIVNVTVRDRAFVAYPRTPPDPQLVPADVRAALREWLDRADG